MHGLMKRTWILTLVGTTMAAMVFARPARQIEPAVVDPIAAERWLDSVASTTIQRLPTCEMAINTRVSEWKASASIVCRKSSTAVEACVAAQLSARAEQLKRIRSCKFL